MSRLAEIASRRAALRREIAVARVRTRMAAVALAKDAGVAIAMGVATRWVTRKWRWTAVALPLVGMLASRLVRRQER